MKQVTEAQFSEQVLLRSFEKPIAVMFTASWCGPCSVVKPRIERLAVLHGFNVVCVDAGEEKALAGFYEVRAVPTLVVFREGSVKGKAAGAGNLGDSTVIEFLNACGFDIVVHPAPEF